MLYTEDGNGETTTFNLIGTEDNILFTARPAEAEETSFYSYTRDLRESTINLVGSDGSSVRSYSYDDFGETKVMGSGDFCNEVCYGAGIYDDTTGLYYLNARYYDPDTGNFLTQDTYRGSRSRTETLNLYGYCAGNPINYTDPSGHWIWGIIGAASGAYDGYKYAKKKKYKGWRKAAVIAGGAALGAVNPFKVFKAARTGYRAYKACKYARKARSYVRKGKALKKIKLKARHTKITKKKYKVKRKPKVVRTSKKTIKKLQRKAKATIKVSKYKVLKKSTSENGQAHHLNQDAAFKDVIPHNEGLAVELQGNAITDIGSPHYKAHAELERFWNNYRKNGELYDQEVKIGDYNKAVYDSLVEAGLSKPDAAYAVERAYRQQRQYGLINSGNVPRLPGRLTQKKI